MSASLRPMSTMPPKLGLIPTKCRPMPIQFGPMSTQREPMSTNFGPRPTTLGRRRCRASRCRANLGSFRPKESSSNAAPLPAHAQQSYPAHDALVFPNPLREADSDRLSSGPPPDFEPISRTPHLRAPKRIAPPDALNQCLSPFCFVVLKQKTFTAVNTRPCETSGLPTSGYLQATAGFDTV